MLDLRLLKRINSVKNCFCLEIVALLRHLHGEQKSVVISKQESFFTWVECFLYCLSSRNIIHAFSLPFEYVWIESYELLTFIGITMSTFLDRMYIKVTCLSKGNHFYYIQLCCIEISDIGWSPKHQGIITIIKVSLLSYIIR